MSPCNRAHRLKYTKLLYPSELVAYSILSQSFKAHTYIYIYEYVHISILHTDDSLFCIEYWIIHLQHRTKSVYIFFLPHFVSPDSENLKAQFEQKQLPRYRRGAHELSRGWEKFGKNPW